MSLDDRIQRLADSIIEEVRGPIDLALRRLLAEVLEVATQDREAAIRHVTTQAAAAQQAALDEIRQTAAAERDEAIRQHAERLTHEHETVVAGLQRRLAADHEAAIQAAHDELARDSQARLAALRLEHAAEREAAIEAVRQEMRSVQGQALDALRQQAASDREAAIRQAEAELVRSLEAQHREATERLTAEYEARLVALDARASADQAAAVQEAVDRLQRDHEVAIASLRAEVGAERDAAVDAARHAAEQLGTRAQAAALVSAQQEGQAAESRARQLSQALATARAEAAQAEADRQSAVQAAEAQTERLRALLAEARVAERQADLVSSGQLAEAVRRVDEAKSLTDVLDILVDHASLHTPRVALLLVNGAHVRSWRLIGLPDPPAVVDVPIDPGGLLGRVVATGRTVSTSDAPLSETFGGGAPLVVPPDRVGLGIPLTVGDRVAIILYVDDVGDQPPVVPSNWPELLEILARHAARRLELLTIARVATVAGRLQQDSPTTAPRPAEPVIEADDVREEESARRYARLLISEIKLYNETTMEQGRRDRNLLERLGPDLDRARRLYEEKIPIAVRRRVDCFEEEIVRTLAGGDRGLLGPQR